MYMSREMRGLKENCDHLWHNDPRFEEGVVEMINSMSEEKEMRQMCLKCNAVRYIEWNEAKSSEKNQQTSK